MTAIAKGTSSHGVWHYHKATFKNYCPQCHCYGTLRYSKYCDGGQWTCSHCDCDFDMQTGYEKITGSNLKLISFTIPKSNIKTDNHASNSTTNSTSQPTTQKETQNKSFMNICTGLIQIHLNHEFWEIL